MEVSPPPACTCSWVSWLSTSHHHPHPPHPRQMLYSSLYKISHTHPPPRARRGRWLPQLSGWKVTMGGGSALVQRVPSDSCCHPAQEEWPAGEAQVDTQHISMDLSLLKAMGLQFRPVPCLGQTMKGMHTDTACQGAAWLARCSDRAVLPFTPLNQSQTVRWPLVPTSKVSDPLGGSLSPGCPPCPGIARPPQ